MKKKILILSDIGPCTNITSGIVLNKWCDFLLEDGHELFYALVKDPYVKMDIPKDKIDRIKFINFDKPIEGWGYDSNKLFKKIKGKVRSFVRNNQAKKTTLPEISKSIINFIEENNIEIILSSIQGQTITWLTNDIINKTKIYHVSQTWDPLEWWLDAFKFDFITKKMDLNLFKKVCKKSDTFMGMSWAMSNEFEKKYHAHCVTNIPSLENETKLTKNKKINNKVFNIALSGQIYAKDEFDLLVKTCDKLGWKYKGKDIYINLYGNYFNEKYKKYNNIIINGHMLQDKLIEELKKMDLLYCPYWFDKKYKKPSRLSFPGKIVTYLKVGRPILMHGPKYASPLIFVKKYNAAYVSETDNEEEFMNQFKTILENKNTDEMLKNANTIFNKYLTYKSMKNSLLVSLGLLDEKYNKDMEGIRKIYEKSN